MTAEHFFCRQRGAISRTQCAACFRSRGDFRRVYLTRAICASANGCLENHDEAAGAEFGFWEKFPDAELTESRVA